MVSALFVLLVLSVCVLEDENRTKTSTKRGGIFPWDPNRNNLLLVCIFKWLSWCHIYCTQIWRHPGCWLWSEVLWKKQGFIFPQRLPADIPAVPRPWPCSTVLVSCWNLSPGETGRQWGNGQLGWALKLGCASSLFLFYSLDHISFWF